MFTPDTVIQNRYRIVRHLEGAQGEVYEAFDETQQKKVNLQVTAIPDDSTLQRLRHVANARSKSVHPSLPGIVEHFEEGGQYLLVTEWIEGSTLAQRLTAQGTPFTPAQVVRWGIQLLDALIVLHRQMPTLAHGDVRAETLVEAADGTIELLGTPLYAIGGTNAPTEDEDVYDTCAVLYHLLTGVQPPAMAGRTARGFLPSADTLNPLVPTSLGVLLAQGLSENEADRFNSAYALQTALKRVQDKLNESETVIAPTRTTPSLAAKLQQRQTNGDNGTATSPNLESNLYEGDNAAVGGATVYSSIASDSPEATPTPDTGDGTAPTEVPLIESAPAVESGPLGGDSLFSDTPADTPPPADPFRLNLGGSEPPPYADPSATEHPAGTPPASEPPHNPGAFGAERPAGAPPPSNQNRLWFALGIGCIGAILCICCSLIGIVTYQFDTIMEELEAAEINLPETEEENNNNNPFESEENNEEPSNEEEDDEIGESNGITVSVFDIKVGDCYQDPDTTEFISELVLVDCDAPHDNEIYAFGLYPADEDASFPEQDELDEFTDEYCTEEFEEYVGIAYEDSIYYITYLQPTEESWEDGDREVVCILYDQDGPMEGSKKDSQE